MRSGRISRIRNKFHTQPDRSNRATGTVQEHDDLASLAEAGRFQYLVADPTARCRGLQGCASSRALRHPRSESADVVAMCGVDRDQRKRSWTAFADQICNEVNANPLARSGHLNPVQVRCRECSI